MIPVFAQFRQYAKPFLPAMLKAMGDVDIARLSDKPDDNPYPECFEALIKIGADPEKEMGPLLKKLQAAGLELSGPQKIDFEEYRKEYGKAPQAP